MPSSLFAASGPQQAELDRLQSEGSLAQGACLVLLAALAIAAAVAWHQRNQLRDMRQRLAAGPIVRSAAKASPEALADQYDVIVRVKSLHDFVLHRQLEVSISTQSALEMAAKHRYRIVAVSGLFDKGKTFVVNLLFNRKLPSGKLHTTEGLSIHWIPEERFLLIDSAGCQAPVSFRHQDADAITDASMTESFLFELVSRLAHHLLFVVSDFTWFEQKYVQMLHKKYVLGKRSSELLVVHNLKDTYDVSEAEHLFMTQMKTRYEGVDHLNQLNYVAAPLEGPPIHHVGICRVPGPAAEKYNEANLKYLRDHFDHGDVLGSTCAFQDLLANTVQEILPKFVLIEQPAGEQVDGAPVRNSELQVAYRPALEVKSACGSSVVVQMDSEHHKRHGEIVFTVRAGCSVEPKMRGALSSLGEVIPTDITFDPKTNIYDDLRTNKRHVIVECPGVSDADIDMTRVPNGVNLTITKHRAINEAAVTAVEPIIQHHGSWSKSIHFDPPRMFELKEDEYRFEDGILHIVFQEQFYSQQIKLPLAADQAAPLHSPGTTTATTPSSYSDIVLEINVAGAGGSGQDTNGSYRRSDDLHNGRPKFVQVGGMAVVYFDRFWKIGSYGTENFIYSMHGAKGDMPPLDRRWTTHGNYYGYTNEGAEPAPVVTLAASRPPSCHTAHSCAAAPRASTAPVAETCVSALSPRDL